MTDIKRRMSNVHEEALARHLCGRRTRGSGNQWRDQMDGSHDRLTETVAFRWDGKATFNKSISVTTEMWEKAVEQCSLERPMLGLRIYRDETLAVVVDLVAIGLEDMGELVERSRRLDDIEAAIAALYTDETSDEINAWIEAH